MRQTTELAAHEAQLNAIAGAHLANLRSLSSTIEDRARALESSLEEGVGPLPPAAEPAPFFGEFERFVVLLAKRELQLQVLMGRYLALARPVYGTVQAQAQRHLHRHQIFGRWAELNHLFLDLLNEYADAENRLKDVPRERRVELPYPEITAPVAAELAALVHEGMLYGDKPYTVHTDETASIVREYFPGFDAMISAAHLHDAIEDAADDASADAIAHQILLRCGDEVHDLVVALTDAPGANRAERKAKTLPKIAKAGWRAVAVKVADRIANVSASSGRHLRLYVDEYPDFRLALRAVGLGVEPLQRMWARLDALMVAAGVYIDPCDQPIADRVATIHPDWVCSS